MERLLGKWKTFWHIEEVWAIAIDPVTGKRVNRKGVHRVLGRDVPFTLDESVTVTQISRVTEKIRDAVGKHFEDVWRITGRGLSPPFSEEDGQERGEAPYLLVGQGTVERLGVVISGNKQQYNIVTAILDITSDYSRMAGSWTQSYVVPGKTFEQEISGRVTWEKILTE